jgi:hydrogenase maturation protein HypF
MVSRSDIPHPAHLSTRRADEPSQMLHDRVICRACAEEILTPSRRRNRYPFAHCNRCGPRLSVIGKVPYDRAHSAMAGFAPCPSCQSEYNDPASRHYRLETIACPKCGPRATLIRFDRRVVNFEQHFVLDDVDAACSLIQKGEVVAIKSPGGYQLACDATNTAAVLRLRRAKQSVTRPLPLMARDLHVISRYCAIGFEEELQLTGERGPIVILRASGLEQLSEEVAPDLSTLGFMMPTTALHMLLLQRMSRPVVMTSGNVSGEPRIVDDEEARAKLGVAVAYALVSDQPILARVDDSVVRVMDGRPRILRRARGYAPASMELPAGFERAPDLCAVGGDRETMFGLLRKGEAILSPYYGALREKRDCADYREAICHYRHLLDLAMSAIALDPSPKSCTSHLARDYAGKADLRLLDVDPQHAHIAACLAENGRSLDAAPVLGVLLDSAMPGGEPNAGGGDFLLADCKDCRRLGAFKPVAMPREAASEPWRSLHAHVTAAIGWREFAKGFGELELFTWLEGKPGVEWGAARQRPERASTSSCGLLFDAVAAALGLCRDRQHYDGEAAMQVEALADQAGPEGGGAERRYPVVIAKPRNAATPIIDPTGMWLDLLRDLASNTPAPIIAARFHGWLAASVAAMARRLAGKDGGEGPRTPAVVLSGACFQNRILLEETARLLRKDGFTVLSHAHVPPHDGALALGQVVVGAARMLAEAKEPA